MASVRPERDRSKGTSEMQRRSEDAAGTQLNFQEAFFGKKKSKDWIEARQLANEPIKLLWTVLSNSRQSRAFCAVSSELQKAGADKAGNNETFEIQVTSGKPSFLHCVWQQVQGARPDGEALGTIVLGILHSVLKFRESRKTAEENCVSSLRDPSSSTKASLIA
ncbi:hypothetical protein B0H19DRAFT_1068894 [Mycena capillaripes]|nr:hypothetical protein B0H19DRAFT_1068894 [Mycena capillaripes]